MDSVYVDLREKGLSGGGDAKPGYAEATGQKHRHDVANGKLCSGRRGFQVIGRSYEPCVPRVYRSYSSPAVAPPPTVGSNPLSWQQDNTIR